MSTADSTAGMQRFVICRFPMVVNKILPDASPEALTATLASDPDFFNDLAYDDVVKAVANIMLISRELFKKVCMCFSSLPIHKIARQGTRHQLKGATFIAWACTSAMLPSCTYTTLFSNAKRADCCASASKVCEHNGAASICPCLFCAFGTILNIALEICWRG